MPDRASALATILFTDLVGSTELLSRAGDEDAQRIFRAHHQLLAETAAAHGGAEVKWLGDGLMAAFGSAADAVRCAIAMQQASRRPVAGERLAIRVGLNAGEAFRDEADYFGTPVVVARRLCDQASGGQILCSELVAGLLAGRAGFSFTALGALELKGVPQPVAALEVTYQAEATFGLVTRLPFVGRNGELSRLIGLLSEAAAGRGGLTFVVGEPGIGKTRLVEELAEAARRDGMEILWGHCLDGDWAPPYAPFAEAAEAVAGGLEPEELRTDLGDGGPALAQLVPFLRERLLNLAEPVPIQPDEERFRLLDAMAHFLTARARRHPVLLCLDDLHWADRSTVAMLRHVARFAPGQRLLVVGTYRDAEVHPGHPLAEALGGLRREVEFERLKLEGLEAKAVSELLDALADHDVLGSVASAIAAETDGNPFFIKEVLRHLLEEGRFVQGSDGRWTADRPVTELGIPEGVREVIDRRLARLSDSANKLLSAASIFDGEIGLGVVAAVAGLDEDTALDALDEALDAQLFAPAGGVDVYAFTHALIRHTLAGELSPSRRGRLHLRAAETLAHASPAERSPARSGEIASQYHRAAGLPGAERGIEHALVAAAHAEDTGAHDEAARFLRMALDLQTEDHSRRPRLLGRLGIALAWALDFDGAVALAAEAGDAIAQTESHAAAAAYLSDAAYVCALAGGVVPAWNLARQGLTYAVARDVAWARMVSFDYERRAAEDSVYPGVPIDSPERRESARILREARLDPLGPGPMEAVFDSRQEALTSANLAVLVYWAGEYARCVPLLKAEALEAEKLGRLARAARCQAFLGSCEATLGRLDEARRALEKAKTLAVRVGRIFPVLYVQESIAMAEDQGWEELAGNVVPLTASENPAFAWASAALCAMASRALARLGQAEEALGFLDQIVPWLERAPAWTPNFVPMACNAAETLWLLQRLDHAAAIEHALREKVIAPDLRYTMVDGRLALARLCALTSRQDEAVQWFGEARRVLSEQGAAPLLAVTDFDETLMYVRGGRPRDIEVARPLLEAAHGHFENLGMTGWIRRAEALSNQLG